MEPPMHVPTGGATVRAPGTVPHEVCADLERREILIADSRLEIYVWLDHSN